MRLSIALSALLSSQTLPPLISGEANTPQLSDGKHLHDVKEEEEEDPQGRRRAVAHQQQGARYKRFGSTQSSQNYNRRNIKMKLMNSRSSDGKTKLIACDPSSSDPDVGVLSCGSDAVCMADHESVMGGFCVSSIPSPYDDWTTRKKRQKQQQQQQLRRKKEKNSRSSHPVKTTASQDRTVGIGGMYPVPKNLPGWADEDKKNGVECVPGISSTDVDVGILGCAIDEICMENPDSDLGGICTTSVTPRRLEGDDILADDFLRDDFILDFDTFYCGYLSCDCSSLDEDTRSGTIVCHYDSENLGTTVYGCYTMESQRFDIHVYADSKKISESICKTFTTTLGEQERKSSTVCQINDSATQVKTMTLDGQPCVSCNDDYRYGNYCDCTNVVEGARIFFWNESTVPLVQECYKWVEGETW